MCISTSYAQVEIQLGYNFGLNSYIESNQDNLCTQFNLGWDANVKSEPYRLKFSPNNNPYEIKNPINWNRTTRGIILSTQFHSDEAFGFEMNFTGCTNISDGKRTRIDTGQEEKLSIKTKFGGVQFLFQYNFLERFSLHGGMGVNILKSRYSFEGDTIIKNQLMGITVKIDASLKVGNKVATLIFPMGFTATIFNLEEYNLKLKLRFTHNFVWNDMLETDFFFYFPYKYKMDSNNLSMLISKTF